MGNALLDGAVREGITSWGILFLKSEDESSLFFPLAQGLNPVFARGSGQTEIYLFAFWKRAAHLI